MIFKFDFWHVTLARTRKYPNDIANYLNSRNLNSLCELGCGLGDISLKVRAKNKSGRDISPEVISAAKVYSFLRFQKLDFQVLDISSEELIDKYDAIIMVNWPHNINPMKLQLIVHSIIKKNLNKGGCMILDTIENTKYKYNHDIAFLTNSIFCDVTMIASYEMGRKIYGISPK
jgi:2-polyprenyl-3-methyl-5-hydroxy-6-metoxy-1,4-benzoquinol methylase